METELRFGFGSEAKVGEESVWTRTKVWIWFGGVGRSGDWWTKTQVWKGFGEGRRKECFDQNSYERRSHISESMNIGNIFHIGKTSSMFAFREQKQINVISILQTLREKSIS